MHSVIHGEESLCHQALRHRATKPREKSPLPQQFAASLVGFAAVCPTPRVSGHTCRVLFHFLAILFQSLPFSPSESVAGAPRRALRDATAGGGKKHRQNNRKQCTTEAMQKQKRSSRTKSLQFVWKVSGWCNWDIAWCGNVFDVCLFFLREWWMWQKEKKRKKKKKKGREFVKAW